MEHTHPNRMEKVQGFDPDRLPELYDAYCSRSDWKPDRWQTRVLDYKGDLTLRSGRQVGKSTTIAKRSVKNTSLYPDTIRLVIAPAQRQSGQLFEKMLQHLIFMNEIALEWAGGYKESAKLSSRQNREAKRRFEEKWGIFSKIPTKTEICLKGNRRIYAFPAGKTGVYLRCFAIDFLDADEAAFIPEPVWVSVLPMLAVSAKTKGLGWQTLLSTPFGKGGYFYNSFNDDSFMSFHVSSETCPRISADFLAKQKARLSKVEYAQEWLGEFIDEFNQYFPTALIKERMTFMDWEYTTNFDKNLKYFLGCDIARFGKDENAFVIIEMDNNQHLKVVHAGVTERKSITDTAGRIMALNDKFKFNRIFIDDAGVGGGCYDILVDTLSKSKVVGLNNAKRRIYDSGDEKKKGILKEDIYSNALVLMERAKIDIISSMKLQKSLKCMTFEYTADRNLRIYGKYSHLSEAFVRACWCTKAKGLNLFAY